MTRNEFLNGVNTWSELRNLCGDYDYPIYTYVYSQYELDDYINEHLVDMARHASDWRDLLESLEAIPTGVAYYIRDEDGDFLEADESDFEYLKDEVFDWIEGNGLFEEEEDGEEKPEPLEEDSDDRYEVGNEGMSIAELFPVPKNYSKGIYNV